MFKMKAIKLLLILSSITYVQPLGFGLKDILKSGTDTSKGIVSKIPDLIPSPDALFKLGLDSLVGLPLQGFADAINQICNYYNQPFIF